MELIRQTPQMTPEQRAELVKSTKMNAAMINFGEAIQWGSETILMEQCANQLEADGVTITTLTAERDAAQASKESYRDAMSSICFTLAVGSGDETTTADEYQRRIEQGIAFLTDPMALRIEGLQAEVARLTAALATARVIKGADGVE